MPAPGLKKALDSSKELEITVTGRKSGKKITLPIWFVRDGEKLLFLPVRGSESNWYRNVKHSSTMGISAGGTSMTAKARPTESAERARAVAEKFRAKYGAADVKKYYSRFDASVEVTLP